MNGKHLYYTILLFITSCTSAFCQSKTSCGRVLIFDYGGGSEYAEIQCLSVSENYNLINAQNGFDENQDHYRHEFQTQSFRCGFYDEKDYLCFDNFKLVIDTLEFDIAYPQLKYGIDISIFNQVESFSIHGKGEFEDVEFSIRVHLLVEYKNRTFKIFESVKSITSLQDIYEVTVMPKGVIQESKIDGVVEFPSVKFVLYH